MTLDTLKDGTHSYTPPALGAGIDTYGINRPAQQAQTQGALRPPSWHVYPVRDSAGKPVPNLYGWDCTFDDFRMGLYKMDRGPFDKICHNLLTSTGESRFEGYFTNVLDSVVQATPDPSSGNDWTLHSCIYKETLVMGIGTTTANYGYLYKEDPSTGAISDMSLPAGASVADTIVSLNTATFNGSSYMVLGKFGTAAKAYSDVAAPPTLVGAMDARTSGLQWIMNVDLPDVAVLGFSLSGFIAWAPGAAYNSTPSIMSSGQLATSFPLGIMSLNSSANRVVYVRTPNELNGTAFLPGMELNVHDYAGALYWNNQRGTDEARLQPRFGIKRVIVGIPVRSGIFATDRRSAEWHNGLLTKPLRVFDNAPANPNVDRLIMGARSPDGKALIIDVNEVARGAATQNTIFYQMLYNWDQDSWSKITGDIDTGGTGKQSYQAASGFGLPCSPFTGNLISRIGQGSGGSWYTKYEPPNGQNPYQLRQTASAVAAGGRVTTAAFAGTTPEFWFPGYEGAEHLVCRIIGPPQQQILDGGAGAFVNYTIGGKTAKFTAGDPLYKASIDTLAGHDNWVPVLQLAISASRATSGTDATLYALNTSGVKVQGLLRMPKGIELTANMLNGK